MGSMAKRKKVKEKGVSKKRGAKPAVRLPAAKLASPKNRYVCSPFLDQDLPSEFVNAVQRLEHSLDLPVWLLIQDGVTGQWDTLSGNAKGAFFAARFAGLERGQSVALLLDSRGGDARCAYEIAKLLRKHCGGFVAVVPRRAKSAATLICLGADEIILGEYGELGPLDVQVMDPDREEWISGLDEVQCLERLNAFALTAFDQAMFLLIKRTGMKVATLLPHVIRLVTDMTEPMFQSVDVVRYTQMSRSLKVGEEYARRLMVSKYGEEVANDIARKLVEKYPEHGFVIDRQEATEIGLNPMQATDEQIGIMEEIGENLRGLTAIGRMAERSVS